MRLLAAAALHCYDVETGLIYFVYTGDGPHYSPAWPSPIHRKSSFGLATLRPDGFIAVRPVTGYTSGAGSISVNVSGPTMLITADTAPSGSVSLWCAPMLSR